MFLLNISPHPDDESLCCPATFAQLRAHGHRVANLALTLGRPEHHSVRSAELRESIRRANLDLFEFSDPPDLSALNPDRVSLIDQIASDISELILELKPDVVSAPSLSDPHPAHRIAAAATLKALAIAPTRAFWQWSIWSDLHSPNLLALVSESEMHQASFCLEAHQSQLDRNDYRRLLWGRALSAFVRGPELVFGFGAPAFPGDGFAELLFETLPDYDFSPGRPRLFDPQDPLGDASGPIAA